MDAYFMSKNLDLEQGKKKIQNKSAVKSQTIYNNKSAHSCETLISPMK